MKKSRQYLVPATLNYDFKINTKSMKEKIIVEWTRLGSLQLCMELSRFYAKRNLSSNDSTQLKGKLKGSSKEFYNHITLLSNQSINMIL